MYVNANDHAKEKLMLVAQLVRAGLALHSLALHSTQPGKEYPKASLAQGGPSCEQSPLLQGLLLICIPVN